MPFGIAHALACLALLAATAVSQPDACPEPDRLVLRDGTVLTGRIVSESTATVTLALDFGGQVEFKKRDLARFERRGAPAAVGAGPTRKPRTGTRHEERFLVYLGERPVGFRTLLRSRIVRRGVAGTLFREEVTFPESSATEEENPRERRACRIVALEFVPDDDGSRTLYYREVGMGSDYIIDAVLSGERLEYTWLRGAKRTFHRERVPSGLTFPVASWFAAARPAAAERVVARPATVFDPRSRRTVQCATRRFAERSVAVGSSKIHVRPIEVRGPRGDRLRWVTRKGRTLKEYLNGVSLVAVATSLRALPDESPKRTRTDRRETEFVRICLDPTTGLVLRAPGAGWYRVALPDSGAAFSLVNREMESTVGVYWSTTGDVWPGPAVPSGAAVKPIAFGGWPGEGWTAPAPGGTDRELHVRRMRTRSGRVTVVLDTSREFASAALIDFAALLRGMRVPGTGRPAADAR